MAIRVSDQANFMTLLKAAKNGDLALIECRDAHTNEYRAVICAIYEDHEGMFNVTPFGHLAPENPYEAYIDPTQFKD